MTAGVATREMYGKPAGTLYGVDMANREMMGVQDFRLNLSDKLKAIRKGLHVILTNRGQAVAAVVPWEWYTRAAEALNDPFAVAIPVAPPPPDDAASA